MDFKTLDPDELKKLKTELTEQYRGFQSRNLAIDMTRGKPSSEDIRLAMDVLATCTQLVSIDKLVGEK